MRSTLAILALLPAVTAGTGEDPDVTDPIGDGAGGLDIAAGWIRLVGNDTLAFHIRLADDVPARYGCTVESTLQGGTFHYVSFYVRPVDSVGEDTARWERGAHVGAGVRTECLLPGSTSWKYEWYQAGGRGRANYVGNETAAEGRIDDGVAVIDVPLHALGDDVSMLTQLYIRSFSGRSGSMGSFVEDLAPDADHGRNVTLYAEPLPEEAPAATGGETRADLVDEKTPWPLWAPLAFAWAARLRRTR